MFKDNKYTKLYYKLIERAVKFNLGKGPGRERHHIIPHSLGGDNTKSNLVYISVQEHFICHWLLVKMTEGDAYAKMRYALRGMRAENKYQKRYNTKITARVYAKYRLEHAAHHSKIMKAKNLIPWNKGGVELTDEHRNKLRIAATGRKYSAASIAKRTLSQTGVKRRQETKDKISASLKGKPKGPMSEEQKQVRSLTQKGVPKIKTHGANVAKAVMGNISINKDGEEKKVKKDSLDSWLSQGWALGGRPRSRKVARR